MLQEKQKETLSPFKSISILFIIIVLAVVSHVNFFLKDARPFLDHSAHYFYDGFLSPLNFLHALLVFLLEKVSPLLKYDSFFLYKISHLFFLISFVLFTYLCAKLIYGRFAALLAAFLLITFPDVLNIFRKSEINMQTASILSLAVYLYFKSNFLQKQSYSLCFTFVIFLFFIHHYGSLLYMGVMFCSFVVPSFFLEKKQDGRNKIIMCLLFFIMVGVDFYFNPVRYAVYFDKCMFYLSKYHVFSGNLFASFSDNFFLRYLENIKLLYNSNLVCFDFHFILSFCAVIFHIADSVYKKIKKIPFSAQENMIWQMTLFVVMGVLCILVGFSNIRKFVIPFCFALSVLNAGAFISIYVKIKSIIFLRVVGIFCAALFFLYGLIILFYPAVAFSLQNNTLNAYVYVHDDFNLSESMKFFEQKKIRINDVGVMAYDDYSVSDAESYLLTLQFKKRGVMDDVFNGTPYLVVFYDLLGNAFFDNIPALESLETKINTFIKAETTKYGDLQEIFTYGVALNNQMPDNPVAKDYHDMFFGKGRKIRQYLIFIYRTNL